MTLTLIVAGRYPIDVELCRWINEVDGECGALVSDMRAHSLWHVRREAQTRVAYCRAGQHEYLKGASALSTADCPRHTVKAKAVKERGKRMMAAGIEKKENIDQRKRYA